MCLSFCQSAKNQNKANACVRGYHNHSSKKVSKPHTNSLFATISSCLLGYIMHASHKSNPTN